MSGRLMHGGKPWLGEGHPPDSPERLAVLGVDEATPVCDCATRETPWMKEGHAPDCAAAPDPKVGKSVHGNAGDSVACACGPDWKGEGHAKDCPKRPAVLACTCRALKFDGEGHHPDCASRQVAEPVAEKPKKKKGE